ncbi:MULTISPECIES: GNAT family N-acetyltransferase [unclassified Synechocystis]|uniref:GNAT family N-acetyltransferase n=1 Tax=unclassified Synechocystis TaxID=2640012 RepID=UPI000410974C|nr:MULTISPECIES: GNAT family N-acetyltransferase [unclassified Synechocystis]AIE74245.1 Acetyltransferase [Synechocystis sp. PCC 6714]MCT0252872.1 GNAT family N-acetyltransferase [Synechocystis sp. CS-94]
MHLRQYHQSDLEAVIEVFSNAVHQLGIQHYSRNALLAWAPYNPDREKWRDRLASILVLIVEDGGAIAGFIGYDRTGLIDLLFVHSAFARRGIATMLMETVEQLAAIDGLDYIHTKASLVARPFFESRGFVIAGEEIVSVGGENLCRFDMIKAIDSDQKAILSLPNSILNRILSC